MHKRFEDFIAAMTRLTNEAAHNEPRILDEGAKLLGDLVRHDDWLDARHAVPHPQFYQQFLLHRAPDDSFSVVSFVWGPGQKTPIHDHTVWGLIGMLRNAEVSQSFDRDENTGTLTATEQVRLEPGTVEAVSPTIGDVHQVINAFDDRVSISIHVYGADIGKVRRHVFDPATGAAKEFVSGYAN
ncbi:cysteine dioxygenase [Diaphorobacter sp. HDW4A]|uniref:cysteine dioxygenase family protein n=1 Tax=Diaphorobacter sp. HDW4A TaxID=2714924 RepID=UPI00140D4FCC|nr:cysteine dioxygenase [Diaphorobacter sp. HDW4A]QIL82499.1 cysteine dioxygenase [Diaphorobacter sp. HDW4A]